jgi:hypothetical protein
LVPFGGTKRPIHLKAPELGRLNCPADESRTPARAIPAVDDYTGTNHEAISEISLIAVKSQGSGFMMVGTATMKPQDLFPADEEWKVPSWKVST